MEDDIQKVLIVDRDRHTEFLDGMRRHILELKLDGLKKQREFSMKIGELALLATAAIGPVAITAKSDLSKESLIFVFCGIGAYFFAGIIAMWRVKTSDEHELNTLPYLMSDTEADVLNLIYAYNRLISDHKNEERKTTLISLLKNFLTKYGDGGQGAINNPRIDTGLDIIISLFCIGTLLIIGALWPFGVSAYIMTFASGVIILVIMGLVSYYRARECNIIRQQKDKVITEIYLEQTSWQLSQLEK